MRRLLSTIILLTIITISFGQQKTFEIFGTFVGEHKDKVYLFFENDFAHRDSLSAPITNDGHFYFKLKNGSSNSMQEVHFGDKSSIGEFMLTKIRPIQILIDREGKVIGFPSTVTDMENLLTTKLHN